MSKDVTLKRKFKSDIYNTETHLYQNRVKPLHLMIIFLTTFVTSKVHGKAQKILISSNESPDIAPSAIFDDQISVTKPQKIANAFNTYVVSAANTFNLLVNIVKVISMIYSLLDFLLPFSFLLNPTDEIESKNIRMSLNTLKAIGSNNIPMKILKLLINDFSSQLTELFNLSLTHGVFPLTLKTNTVMLDESQLQCSKHRSKPLLCNNEKILEELMYSRLCNVQEMNSY